MQEAIKTEMYFSYIYKAKKYVSLIYHVKLYIYDVTNISELILLTVNL